MNVTTYRSLWAEAEWVNTLGWMLVHSLWLLFIPAAMLSILLLAVPQSWSRVKYVAGMVVLLAMVVLPLAVIPFLNNREVAEKQFSEAIAAPLTDFPRERSSEQDDHSDENYEDTSLAFVDTPLISDEQQSYPPVSSVGDARGATIVESEAVASQTRTVDDDILTLDTVTSDSELSKLVEQIRPWLPWTVAVWLIGSLLMTIRLLTGWWSAERLRRDGRSSVPVAVQKVFEELRETVGASRAARVAQSAIVKVPSVIGHFQPIVLLPVSAVTGLSEQQLRAIIAHELAHVRRFDYAVNIFQSAIESVLFYHPAVWWVSRIVRMEREHCCDDIALAAQCSATELAKALVAVEAERGKLGSELVAAADGGNLLRRVRRLAGNPSDDRLSRRSWVAGLLSLGLVAVVCSLAILPAGATSDAAQNDTEVATDVSNGVDDSDEETTDDSLTDEAQPYPGRVTFEGGYFLEVTAIADYVRLQGKANDGEKPIVWNAAGEASNAPFAGTQVADGHRPRYLHRSLDAAWRDGLQPTDRRASSAANNSQCWNPASRVRGSGNRAPGSRSANTANVEVVRNAPP